MRLATLLLFAASACFAQVSITNPASNSTVSGFSYPLSVKLTNIANAASLEWDIDQQTIVVLYTCSSGTACPAYDWNPADFGNGLHQITAIVRDALNNTVATSPTVSFTVNNALPCNDGNGRYDEQITVTPSTSVTSNWSGQQTLTVSASGTQCSSYPWDWYANIDGDTVASFTSSTASGGTLTLQTQNFYNGTRQVSVSAYQVGGGLNAPQFMGSWLASVTFSNTSTNLTPVEMTASAKEVFLTPSSSAVTVTGTEIENDATKVARTPGCALLTNPDGTTTAPVTISSQCTVTPTGSIGNGMMVATDPWLTGTNAHTDATTAAEVYVNSSLVAPYMIGWYFQVISGTGWTPGAYKILNVQTIGCSPNCRLTLASAPAAANAANGTFALGPGNSIFVTVNSQNAVPHFTRNGGIRSTYSPTASLYSLALFATSDGAWSYPNWITDYLASGWNTYELGLGCSVASGGTGENLSANGSISHLLFFSDCSGGGSESAWQSNFTSSSSTLLTVGNVVNLAERYGFYLGFIATSATAPNNTEDIGVYDMTQGAGSTYTGGPVWTQMLNYWNARGNACTPTSSQKCYGSALRIDTNDEVTSSYGGLPIPGATFGTYSTCGGGGTLGGTCGPTQIVSKGTTCTVTYPGWSVNGASRIIITGATTSGFNSAYPNTYTITKVDNSHFTFACSVATGTYNSTTDPNLAVEIFGAGWNTSTTYILDNAISTIMGETPTYAGTFSPPITWPVRSGSYFTEIQNWMKDPRVASYGTYYYVAVASNARLMLSRPFSYPIYNLLISQIRATQPYSPADQAPWCSEGAATPGTYAQTGAINRNIQTGTAISIVSFIGNTLTTSADHGLRNVLPGSTRIVLRSMSNSADNGLYWVIAAPNSTTLHLAWCGAVSLGVGTGSCDPSGTTEPANPSSNWPTFSTCTSGGGCALTFDNGDTEHWPIGVYGGQNFLSFGNPATNCKVSDIGHYFTVSGSSSSYWNTSGRLGWYGTASDNTCQTSNSQVFAIPNGSSTSGSMELLQDNSYHAGISLTVPRVGPASSILQGITAIILGATCTREYLSGGPDPQFVDPISGVWGSSRNTLTDNYSELNLDEFQVGAWTHTDIGGSRASWWAGANYRLLLQRFAKFMLNSRFNSPDFGNGFIAAARGDGGATYGNGLIIQSFWDVTKTVKVNLTPYLISGQAIWKYVSTPLSAWTITQIAAGTSSDTTTCPATCTVFYAFSKAGAAEVEEPALSARLADITNATQVAVRYSCTPWPIGQPVSPVVISVASLSSGTTTLPVDPQLCANNYQLLYLNNSGAILATSTVQQLAWQQ